MTRKTAYVYILASKRNGTLYTGVTSDLLQRMAQHRDGTFPGFTAKYDVKRLVWFIESDDVVGAIALEKKIKNRGRAWKIAVIEKENPGWADLSEPWLGPATSRRMTGAPPRGNGGAVGG